MKETSYIHKLRFDQKLNNSLIAKYLRNPRLFLLIVLAVVVLGIVSFLSLPRRLNPEINIPIVIVSSVLPGSSPTSIESLVTIPIEDALSDVDNVSTLTSSSQANVSVTTLEFTSGTDAEKARSDVQAAVDSVDLPEDATTPRVQKLNFENQPVLTFVVTGRDSASLMRFGTRLQDELEAQSAIKEVSITGFDEQEIQVVLRPETLATYGVSPQALSGSIASALGSFPSGTITTGQNAFSLTVDPTIIGISDIRETVIAVNNRPVQLGLIADVQEVSKPDFAADYYASQDTAAQRAVTFNVFKTDAADITDAANQGEAVVEEALAEVEGFTLATITNNAEEITDQFNELLRDFTIIVILIFIALFFFLGLRQAFVAALSVPFTFLISFTVMNLSGISINFLSLFSLLLSLGLLVDDTIVVISAMTSYHRTGRFTPIQTALLVFRDFIVAIFTTTITTVWAFLPLLLATGIIGEFIKSIPIVVSSTLLASFFVAIAITMPFIIILFKPKIPNRVHILLKILGALVLVGIALVLVPTTPIAIVLSLLAVAIVLYVTRNTRRDVALALSQRFTKAQRSYPTLKRLPYFANHGIVTFERIENKYKSILQRILVSKTNRRKVITMVIIFSLFSYLLLPLGFVRNEFFPGADTSYLYVSVELPSGTSLRVSEQEAVSLLNKLRTTDGVEFVTASIGQSFDEFGGTGGGASNNLLFTLRLPEDESKSSSEIAATLRETYREYQKGELSVVEISGGPPAGADLQIKLFGDDLDTLLSYADRTKAFLQEQDGIENVSVSITPGTSKIVFTPDQEELVRQGVSREQIAGFLRLYGSGLTADTIRLENGLTDETDITLRLDQEEARVEDFGTLSIPTQNGNVLLSTLGTLTLSENPTLITREDGERTVSVAAAVLGGYTTSEKNADLENFANTELNLAEDYRWETGGVNEENQASVNSMLQAMLLSFLLIVVTMVFQFGSFRKAIIVMLVIPLSISGVFILFAITNTPLSFPALIGILALFGIVVKNAILVVDKIKQNREVGLSYIDAIVDGSSSRLEAIALTSVTAILGLIPITLSDPLWRGLGGAIIAGLTFSGTIMLFFIPIVYYYWFHDEER